MACLVGRDLRTVTGRNLRLLQTESGLDPWVQTPATIKKVLREKEDSLGIPPGNEWRVPYLALLLEQKQTAHYGAMEREVERLSELIDSLCIN